MALCVRCSRSRQSAANSALILPPSAHCLLPNCLDQRIRPHDLGEGMEWVRQFFRPQPASVKPEMGQHH